MLGLKTLKEIEEYTKQKAYEYRFGNVSAIQESYRVLREEAKRWIGELVKRYSYTDDSLTRAMIESKIEWIEMFFNLEE